MKILILSDDFPPQISGGASRVAFDLAIGLQRAGHQISVITTCREKKEEKDTNYGGLNIFRIYANYHERWRAYLSLYNPQTVGRVKELIREIKPDVIHAHNLHRYLSYHCLKIAKKYCKAVFLTAHDAMLFNYERLATQKYLQRFDYRTNWLDHLRQAGKRYNPFRNIINRHYLKYVDKIFTVSNAVKEALKANGISNTEVIYNGIDVKDWEISPELVEGFKEKYNLRNKRIILLSGRISKLKGIEQIESAMLGVQREVPEAILLMIGRVGLGWLSGDELKAAYHSADIVVTPSICFDTFNRTNIEAMACQKPVVGTRYGGTIEIVQDGVTGYIVNPFDTEAMAEKIIILLENSEKAERFGQMGLERVKENFSLQKQVQETLRWYQKYIYG